ncbi:MAG: hypothetical protein R6U38_13935 [Desulfatiglandaceae bacterium]
MEFEIHPYDGIFEVRTYGDAEFGKFRDILEGLVTHEKWQPGTPFLMNHTELNSATLTNEDMRQIAELNGQYSARVGPSKCALLLPRDLEYGMGRIWEAFVEDKWDASEELFRSREEAIEWLSD